MNRATRWGDALARGPVLLDSAHGTRLIARGLDLNHDDPALWVLDRPDEVARLHALDIEAGADALLTDTFGANRTWLARYGRSADVLALNRRAVALAREAAGPARLVIGSIGPTGWDDPDPDAGIEQADALVQAGADAIALETQLSEKAIIVLHRLRARVPAGFPIVVSLYQWPDAPKILARYLGLLSASALGVNCVPGMSAAAEIAMQIGRAVDLPVWIKPNPGGPCEPPEEFARQSGTLLDRGGPMFLGGCCGTNEAHIASLRRAIDDRRPAPPD